MSEASIIQGVELKYVLLADSANLTENKRLNVLGVFDQINVPDGELPYVHPMLSVVIFAQGTKEDDGKAFDFTLAIQHEESGKILAQLPGTLTINNSSVSRPRFNQGFAIAFVEFKDFGSHLFIVDAGKYGKQSAFLEIADPRGG
ncbi:MAG: hypothetical protein KF836_07715 [Fimbriimonadaceae bacterium]|nr:hypothetical protein [Fimbriimonadaceae bacterium]